MVPETYLTMLKEQGIYQSLGWPFPEWTPEKSLEVMNKNGIRYTVLSISSPGVYFGDTGFASELARQCNITAAGIMAKYPDRLGAFAALPLPDTDKACDEISHALDKLKLNGVGLLTNYDGVYLGDSRFDDVYSELNKRKAVVYVHPTDPPHRNPLGDHVANFLYEVTFDTTRAITNIVYNGVAEKYPDIRFVFAHAGGTVPFLSWRISLGLFVIPEAAQKAPKGFLHYLKNFYYDTGLSATPYALSSLQNLTGASRIVFGTDYPFAPEIISEETVKGLNEYDGFSGAERAAVERENAIKLLNLSF
jgi:predicted TIM-barrel fold metal-dependent hydrolase